MTKHSNKALERFLKELRRELDGSPTNLKARVNLARTYYLLDRPQKAIREYTTVARYAVRSGDYDNALAACRTILRMRPDMPLVVDMVTRLTAMHPKHAGSGVVKAVSPEQARATMQRIAVSENAATVEPIPVVVLKRRPPSVRPIDGSEHGVLQPPPFVRTKSGTFVAIDPDPPGNPFESVELLADDIEELASQDLEFVDYRSGGEHDLSMVSFVELDELSWASIDIDDSLDAPLQLSDDDLLGVESVELLEVAELPAVQLDDELDDDDYSGIRLSPQALLQRVPFFKVLDLDGFVELFRSVKVVSQTSGDYVYREGQRGDFVYLLARGYLVLEKKDPTGQTCQIATLEPGDIFGEGLLFGERFWQESARSAGNVELMTIYPPAVRKVMESSEAIASLFRAQYHDRLLERLLQTQSLFRVLSDLTQRDLIPRFRGKKFLEGQLIIGADQRVDRMMLLASGSVDLFRETAGQRVGSLNAGDLIGIVGLEHDVTAGITAVCKRDSVVFSLAKTDFARLKSMSADFSAIISRVVSMRKMMLESSAGLES